VNVFKLNQKVRFCAWFNKLDYDGVALAGREAVVTWVRPREGRQSFPYKVTTATGGINDLPVTENEIEAF
jgi:hypothetical protein